VFDNKSPQYAVDAVSNPLNLYGKTKLNGEEATLAAGKGNITSSFYVQENYMIQNKKKSRSWLSSSVNIKNRMAFPNGIHRLSKCDLNKFTLLCGLDIHLLQVHINAFISFILQVHISAFISFSLSACAELL